MLSSTNILKLLARLRPHFGRATWAVLEQAINPLIMVILTPYLFLHLGALQFGLYVFATTFIGLSQFVSLGASTATLKHVSADISVNNKDAAVATIRAAVTLTIIFGGILVGIVSAFSDQIAKIAFSKMGTTVEVSFAIRMGMFFLIIQELDSIFSNALKGALRYDISAKIELVGRCIWALFLVFITFNYHSADAIFIGILVFSFLKVFFKAYQVNKVLEVEFCYKPQFLRMYFLRVIDFGKWQWIQSIGGILFSVIDRFFVGAVFGSADLARYNICVQLAQYVHVIPSVAAQVMFPWLSAKNEKKENTQHFDLFKIAIYLGILSSLLAISMLFLAPLILKLWMGELFYINNIKLGLILIFAYGVLAFHIPAHYFLMGLGQIKYLSLSNLAAGISCLLCSLALLLLGLEYFAASRIIYGFILINNFMRLKKVSINTV